ncbi:porphobilinogen deaminase [Mucor ambiguus]|uniref:hydroxymethylbilane synthase n=1 Tax=Mucor ambiguus TaxID=91626 RepID=A0A0C9N3Y5_9FUNG|nr:porphobilinogen deaminase [Mucor ambiguus]
MTTDSTAKTVYRIGTRKSKLALVQTEMIKDYLSKAFPQYEFILEGISTTGDRILDVALSKIGEKALFTKELEVALEDGRVDFVVHCLKDLPTTLPRGIALGAVMERENPNDALVLSPKYGNCSSLADLPEGSVVGTSSLRRVAQLKNKYPHLIYKDVRGNVDTRLAKLDNPEGEYAAIILAVAGLVRLHLEHRISQVLPLTDSLYAVSQGALGIECREDDVDTRRLLNFLNHHPTRTMCSAERSLMRRLEGGCSVPIGVCSSLEDRMLSLRGLVASLDGQQIVEFDSKISLQESASFDQDLVLANELGTTVADGLIERGAGVILAGLSH